MSKHISKERKYHYIMMREQMINNQIIVKEFRDEFGDTSSYKTIRDRIRTWHKRYMLEGLEALESFSGKTKGEGQGRPKKKDKKKKEDMTKEELLEYIEILEISHDYLKKKSRKRDIFNLIFILKKSKPHLAINWLANFFDVSKSGYYKWMSNGMKSGDTYKKKTMDLVKREWERNGSKYGALMLKSNMNGDLALNTIRRYMKHLGIKGKYKVPTTRKAEIKDTSSTLPNLVNGHLYGWKRNLSRTILSTDTSEYKINGTAMYFSIVIEAGSDYIHDLKVSKFNDKRLMLSNIKEGCKKAGRKFYLQTDNAQTYRGQDCKNIVYKLGGLSSFGRPGKSQDNSLVERTFGIIKDEYLRVYKPNNFKEFKEVLNKAIIHYNYFRKSPSKGNKTPSKCLR